MVGVASTLCYEYFPSDFFATICKYLIPRISLSLSLSLRGTYVMCLFLLPAAGHTITKKLMTYTPSKKVSECAHIDEGEASTFLCDRLLIMICGCAYVRSLCVMCVCQEFACVWHNNNIHDAMS